MDQQANGTRNKTVTCSYTRAKEQDATIVIGTGN